jgi:hypothetical protein
LEPVFEKMLSEREHFNQVMEKVYSYAPFNGEECEIKILFSKPYMLRILALFAPSRAEVELVMQGLDLPSQQFLMALPAFRENHALWLQTQEDLVWFLPRGQAITVEHQHEAGVHLNIASLLYNFLISENDAEKEKARILHLLALGLGHFLEDTAWFDLIDRLSLTISELQLQEWWSDISLAHKKYMSQNDLRF